MEARAAGGSQQGTTPAGEGKGGRFSLTEVPSTLILCGPIFSAAP